MAGPNFVAEILADIDEIRGIPDEIGIKPFTVAVRVITWSGSRVGVGTSTTVDTPLRVAAGTRNVGVTFVSSKDAVASGGQYTNTDYKIGPLTPSYAAALGVSAGGVAPGTIDPLIGQLPTEIYYVLNGPGIPAGGILYKRVGAEMAMALHYNVIVRTTGVSALGTLSVPVTNNLVAWFDPASSVVGAGGLVSTMLNRVTGGVPAVQTVSANQPTYNAGAFTGRTPGLPGLVFSGAQSLNAAIGPIPGTPNAPFTLVSVVKTGAIGAVGSVAVGFGSGSTESSAGVLIASVPSQPSALVQLTSDQLHTNGAFQNGDSAPHLFVLTFDGVAVTNIRVDGRSFATTTSSIVAGDTFATLDALRLGDAPIGYVASAGLDYFFTGTIGTTLLYKAAISGSDLANTEAYLKGAYGIQ